MDVWAKGREIYFFMKFSKPFERAEVYSSGRLQSAAGEVRGTALRCVLNLKTGEDEIVYVKTGISGVSIDGAKGNLEAEIPAWDFGQVREAAHAAWQRELAHRNYV